jgi:D-serine deaminase-like pyridoxal phosphate-dependent protein
MVDIRKPTLVLDKDRVYRNVERMAAKARDSEVRLRPHCKTHQSAEVADWLHDFGVDAISVSSVDMACYFATHGWTDITIAFPVNVLELDEIDQMAKAVSLGVLVESVEAVRLLHENLKHQVSVWIKIDTGYGRTGIGWNETDRVADVARETRSGGSLLLRGLLCHAGHSYDAGSVDAIRDIHAETIRRIQHLKSELVGRGFGDLELSVGDTPTCSVAADFRGVDEVRPGTFFFYDLKQRSFGVCSERDIAIALACPVVALHPERSEVVLYGGAIHLSKDCLVDKDGNRLFGRVCLPKKNGGWGPSVEGAYVSSVSQEHGIVKFESDGTMEGIQVGDVLMVLPVHCCLTANLMGAYTTLDGNVIDTMASSW